MTWLAWLMPQIDGITLLLFIVVLTLGVFVRCWTGRPRNIPPFPATPYPFVGHLPYMKDNHRKIIAKWTQEQGEIFSVYFGSRLVVFLNSYDVIKETLVKQADIFSGRPTGVVTKMRGYTEGKGVVGSSGKVWKEQRAVTQTILRRFGMGKNFLAQKIQEEIKFYLDELGKFQGEPTDVRILTTNSISNNICSIVLGKRYDYDDPYFTELLKLMDEFFKVIGASRFFTHRFMKYLPGDLFGFKKIMSLDARFIKEMGDGHVNKAKARVDTSDETDHYLLAYLREMKKRQKEKADTSMDDVNLLYQSLDLFFAGTETTSTTIMWYLLYMLHYPEIQDKIYKEIVDVIGVNRFPEMADKERMNYLNASIMETQRIASILPFNIMHKTTSATTVRGYDLPKGTRIVPQLDAVLLDEKTWKEPNKFNPGHFLDENGGLVIPEQFIPFSVGRRVCVGEPLAKMELFLYLASILQRFELKPADPNHLPPLEDDYGLTVPPKPYPIRFIERNN